VRLLCSAEAMPFELFANVMSNREAKERATGGGGWRPGEDLVSAPPGEEQPAPPSP
jgi:hypothetical protein